MRFRSLALEEPLSRAHNGPRLVAQSSNIPTSVWRNQSRTAELTPRGNSSRTMLQYFSMTAHLPEQDDKGLQSDGCDRVVSAHITRAE